MCDRQSVSRKGESVAECDIFHLYPHTSAIPCVVCMHVNAVIIRTHVLSVCPMSPPVAESHVRQGSTMQVDIVTVHAQDCVCVDSYAFTHTHTHTHIAYAHTQTHCIYIYIYIYIYIHTHTHTYIHTHKLRVCCVHVYSYTCTRRHIAWMCACCMCMCICPFMSEFNDCTKLNVHAYIYVYVNEYLYVCMDVKKTCNRNRMCIRPMSVCTCVSTYTCRVCMCVYVLI
jgi:hypothetical protein